jgi:restriction system protein
MTVWLVRAGEKGEFEDFAVINNVAVIIWRALSDLSTLRDRKDLRTRLENGYPNENPRTLANWESQVWSFIKEINEGDIVVLPLKKQSGFMFGEVVGDYFYIATNNVGEKHTRPVKWIKLVQKDQIDEDIRQSLRARQTVCRICRNNAEERIRAKLNR